MMKHRTTNMTDSSVRGPLFKWFGSKWLGSKYYPAPHSSKVVEPFAGGAGYSLRYCNKEVLLAESNQQIRELWRWMIEEASSDLVMDIPLGIGEGFNIQDLPLSMGQKLLLKNWQRTNNVGNCWTISPWGNKPGQWTESTRARVAEDIYQVKHWRVVDDGFSLLESSLSDDDSITWFIDPIYQYNYQYGVKGFDHQRLARAVNSLRGQVIVCEAVCPKTKAVPDYLPFTFFRKSVTSRRAAGSNTHSKELIFWKTA